MTTLETPKPDQEPDTKPAGVQPASRVSVFLSALKLAFAVGLTLVAAMATVAALYYLVPDQNDYARASVLKHERLDSLRAPRLVLVGGSNLAYGADSEYLEAQTGCPTVNMGMNGFFGVRFMLEEVRPSLRASDIVVIALEYDSFLKPVEGWSADLAMVTKYNPAAFSYLTLSQTARLAPGIVYGAQQKALRLMREAGDGVGRLFSGAQAAPEEELIERYSGFSPRGDLLSHLGVAWVGEKEEGDDATNKPLSPDVIPLLQSFVEDMRQRGVTVLISQTPIAQRYYDRHGPALEALHARLAQALPNAFIARPPVEYMFPQSMMFDTDYHLNAEGRQRRSALLAQDILRRIPGGCGGSRQVNE